MCLSEFPAAIRQSGEPSLTLLLEDTQREHEGQQFSGIEQQSVLAPQ
jgi:hypothetical protein